MNKKESDKEVCIVGEEDNNYNGRSVSPNGSISVKLERSTNRQSPSPGVVFQINS